MFRAEGLKAFLSLSSPRVILEKFGKKPFPEFLKAFPDLEKDLQTFPATSKTFPSRQMKESFPKLSLILKAFLEIQSN